MVPNLCPFPQVPSGTGAVQPLHPFSCRVTRRLGWSPGMFILRHPFSVLFFKKKKIMLIK